jgi:RNA polymerase sigma factor (sigma-70 family)
VARIRARASDDPYSDGSLSDQKLISLSRSGDTAAYAELWRRHSAAGLAVARSYTSGFDADDVVSEAFARILKAVQSGGGPNGAFRPYLFTTIRNTAAGWGRARHEIAIEHAEEIEDPEFSEENALNALDHSLTATAFRSLPTRWQEALWYSEVEQMTPQQIGPLLGMKANAVAALTYRAREGLRQAWIQAHLATLPAGSECRWTVDRLGGYARRSLGKRETVRIERHLAGCARCTIVAAEADEVGSRLALVLLPLVAGVGGAAAYSAFIQSGGHVTMVALGANGAVGGSVGGAGGTGTVTAGANTAGGALGASGAVIGTITVSALAVAGVSAALVFGPVLFRGDAVPIPSIDVAAPTQTTDAAPPPVDVVVPPALGTTPPVTAPPVIAPSPGSRVDPDDEPDAGAGVTPQTAAAIPPVTQPTRPVTPPVDPTTPPTPPTTPPPVVVPGAPVVNAPDTGGGLYYPVLSGTGEPGATVTVTQATSGAAMTRMAATSDAANATLARVSVDASGKWKTDQIADPGPFSVSQTNFAGTSPAGTTAAVELHAPVLDQPIDGAPVLGLGSVHIQLSGTPGARVEARFDAIWDAGEYLIPESGTLGFDLPISGLILLGTHTVAVRYVDAGDPTRFGVETSVSVLVLINAS